MTNPLRHREEAKGRRGDPVILRVLSGLLRPVFDRPRKDDNMFFKTHKLPLATTSPFQFIDVTDEIATWILSSKLKNGMLTVTSQHTTAAIKVNEKCSKLEKDLLDFWNQIVPTDGAYRHNKDSLDGRPNAHSHLLHYFLNTSETLTVQEGNLLIGNWQRIFFVELDGPREKREVLLSFVGV